MLSSFACRAEIEFKPYEEYLSSLYAQSEYRNMDRVLDAIEEYAKANGIAPGKYALEYAGIAALDDKSLFVSYPEIYAMQARAVFTAAYKLQAEKVDIKPEIMIPIVMNAAELKLIIYGKKIEGKTYKGIIDIEEDIRKALKAKAIPYRVGSMIELPAAALVAGEIAKYSEFFSFGTNDLTQTTLGISRDDFNTFMPDYSLFDLVEGNPFSNLVTPVKELVAMATRRGRMTRPSLQVGLCGEHGANPDNVRFCMEAELDYVSCSPYSVPIACLAVAQAELEKAK